MGLYMPSVYKRAKKYVEKARDEQYLKVSERDKAPIDAENDEEDVRYEIDLPVRYTRS
jgi:hypothetical protein